MSWILCYTKLFDNKNNTQKHHPRNSFSYKNYFQRYYKSDENDRTLDVEAARLLIKNFKKDLKEVNRMHFLMHTSPRWLSKMKPRVQNGQQFQKGKKPTSIDGWKGALLSYEDTKGLYYFGKLASKLSNKSLSFGIAFSDIMYVLDNNIVSILRNNIIILFGQIFCGFFFKSDWFYDYIVSNISNFSVLVRKFFYKNPYFNGNLLALEKCRLPAKLDIE